MSGNGNTEQDQHNQPTWTIMLYLSGDNNLSPEMVRALADIKLQGLPKNVTFTIQYDPQSPGFSTFRYAITPEELTEEERLAAASKAEAAGPLPIPEYFVKRLKDEDSANPDVLARFIRWSVDSYPSTHRMLILSGHGSGAVGDFLSDSNARLGRPSSLTIPELARALQLAQEGYQARCKIDVLGMDSCLMGMVEVASAVSEHVSYLVGSEGFVPNAGWPYSHLLQRLKKGWASRRMTPANLAKKLVEDSVAYYKQYIPAGVSFDMALCDLTQLKKVSDALRDLTKALALPAATGGPLSNVDKTVLDALITCHWRAQSYKFEQYTDLWDFCDRLGEVAERLSDQFRQGETLVRFEAIAKACTRVKETIGAMAHPRHSGPEFQHSHGLAVFFPWSTSILGGNDALSDYANLAFPKESEWAAFLNAYLHFSEREPFEKDGALLQDTQRPALAPVPSSVRHAEGPSKHAEGASKFADVITRLYGPGGTTLPWSMKNPPQGVRWPLENAASHKDTKRTPVIHLRQKDKLVARRSSRKDRRNGRARTKRR